MNTTHVTPKDTEQYEHSNTPLQVFIHGTIRQEHLQYALISEEQWASALCAFVHVQSNGRGCGNQTTRQPSWTRTIQRFQRVVGLPTWDHFHSTPTFFDIQQHTRVGRNRSTVFETPVLRCMRLIVFSLRRRWASTGFSNNHAMHDCGTAQTYPLDAEEREHLTSMSSTSHWTQLLMLRALECVAVRRRLSTNVMNKVFCTFVTSPHVWSMCRWSWLFRHTAFPHFFPSPWKGGSFNPCCLRGHRDCNDHTWLVRLAHPRPGSFESKTWWSSAYGCPSEHTNNTSAHQRVTVPFSGAFATPPSIIPVTDRKVASETHARSVLQIIWRQCVDRTTSQDQCVALLNHVLQPNAVCGKSQSTFWHWCAVRGWHRLSKKLQEWCGVVDTALVANAYGVTPAAVAMVHAARKGQRM